MICIPDFLCISLHFAKDICIVLYMYILYIDYKFLQSISLVERKLSINYPSTAYFENLYSPYNGSIHKKKLN